MRRKAMVLVLVMLGVVFSLSTPALAKSPATEPAPPPGPSYTSLPDGITLHAPSVVKAGQEIDVDAILAMGGVLRADAGLHFIIDDIERRMVRTDATGTAHFRLRGVLASGVHQLVVRYDGTSQYYFSAPASATATFDVAPLIITVQTVPAVPGVTLKLDDGRGVVSDATGETVIGVARAGIHTLAVSLPPPDPTSQISFVRWSDDSWTPSRTIRVVKDISISVGLRASYLTPIEFVGLDSKPVDPTQVSDVVISGPNAEVMQLQYPYPPIWLQTPLPAKHSGEGGLHITPAPYSLSFAKYNRLNVASVGQFRYTPAPGGTWQIKLLLFTLSMGAKDAIFGTTLNSPIKLIGPTGRVQVLSLDQQGRITLVLSRGNYAAQVLTSGVTPIATIALSRSQEVIVPVITPIDLTLITFTLLVIIAAIFVAGRGRLWAFARVATVRVRYGDRLVRRWERGSAQRLAFQGAAAGVRLPQTTQMHPGLQLDEADAGKITDADSPPDTQTPRILGDGFSSIDGRPGRVPNAEEADRPQETALGSPTISVFPRGGLFGGEAGAGSIVDVGLMVRNLLSSGQAKTVLILVHQSAIREWQDELHDKFGLQIPRLDRGGFYSHEDREMAWSGNPWGAFPVMLASSHLARRRDRRAELLAGGPWDVVIVGDAHEARRSGRMPQAVPNKLLALLVAMKASHSWTALYLASDAPGQLRLHEALEFMDLIGLNKMPADVANDLARYFRIPPTQRPDGDWEFLRQMCADYIQRPPAAKAGQGADHGLPRRQRSRRVRRIAAKSLSGTAATQPAAELGQ